MASCGATPWRVHQCVFGATRLGSNQGSNQGSKGVTEGPNHSEIIGFSDYLRLLAGGPGFEPRLTESESAVLPLNYPPTGARESEQAASIAKRARGRKGFGRARQGNRLKIRVTNGRRAESVVIL